MRTDQSVEGEAPVVIESAALWNMPWHARLKNLADARRPGAAPVFERPAGSVHSWLERVRDG